MKRRFALLGLALFPFTFSHPLWAQGGHMALELDGQFFSAELDQVPLSTVLEKINKETGIWYKGSESLSNYNVSVQFKDLPLQDGLERILSGTNYSFIFDRNGRLLGIVILGDAIKSSGTERKWGTIRGRTPLRKPSPRTRAPRSR